MEYNYEPLLDPFSEYKLALNEMDANESVEVFNTKVDKVIETFEKGYEGLIKSKTYFYGCPFKIYEDHYKQRLESYLFVFPDATEIDFIKEELEKGIFDMPYNNIFLGWEQGENFRFLFKKISFSLKKRFDFLQEKANELGFEIIVTPYEPNYEDDPGYTYTVQRKEHGENSETQNHTAKIENSLTQTELLELVKALIQAEKVKGKQKDIITAFSQFFSVEIKNPDQTIYGFKGRNNDRETIFLDSLRTALFDYIKH